MPPKQLSVDGSCQHGREGHFLHQFCVPRIGGADREEATAVPKMPRRAISREASRIVVALLDRLHVRLCSWLLNCLGEALAKVFPSLVVEIIRVYKISKSLDHASSYFKVRAPHGSTNRRSPWPAGPRWSSHMLVYSDFFFF